MLSPGSNAAGAETGTPLNASSIDNKRAGAPPHCAPSDPGQAACPATDSRLAALIAEHDDLDVAISVLLEAGKRDDLLITRLKKRKLQIKDEMKKRQCAIIDAKAAYGLEYSDQGSDFTPRAQRPL